MTKHYNMKQYLSKTDVDLLKNLLLESHTKVKDKADLFKMW